MKWWLWLALAIFLATMAGATWYAFSSPTFVAGLSAVAVGALWKALKPIIFKLKTDAEYEVENDSYLSGEEWDHVNNRPRRK